MIGYAYSLIMLSGHAGSFVFKVSYIGHLIMTIS
jgi:hypothetical protein